MEDYKKQLALTLADIRALFFDKNLVLKDGRPTPYFINMAAFNTGRLILQIGSFFAAMLVSRGLVKNADIILGPSYKGISLALATSIALWKEYGIDLPFEYDRKESKKHGEASTSKNMFVNGTFFDGCRIFIVDDVATSMSTKYGLLEKIKAASQAKNIKAQVTGIAIGIDREQTTAVYGSNGKVIPGRRGENAIQDFFHRSGIPVYAVAGIREVVEYLYREKVPVMIQGKITPIDEYTKTQFDEYIKIYGVI